MSKSKKPTPPEERFELKMDPNLLIDVIKRQAGTLAKCVLEGVMNSIDARAKECHVMLNSTVLSINDDGCGITDREAIEKHFATFGTPHTADENKIYGTFRMGRGQLFAFGRNTWHTGNFRMTVDIDNDGLSFGLAEREEIYDGCMIEIELYKPLLPSEIAETEELLTKWLKYAPIPVFWNGEQLSKDPAKEKWTEETDDAYIRLMDRGSLEVYNLGIHVCDYHKHQLGTGGVIVSKQQLKVNFARNDIQSDCPVWKRIKPLVNQRTTSNLKRKPRLDNDERHNMIRQFITKQLSYDEFRLLKVFELADGKTLTLSEWFCTYPKISSVVCFAPTNDVKALTLLRRKQATVLSTIVLTQFGVSTPQKLLDKLRLLVPTYVKMGCQLVEFDNLSAEIDAKISVLQDKDLTDLEKLWLRVMQFGFTQLASERDETARIIVIIDSETVAATTDGFSMIAISRQVLRELDFDIPGLFEVGRHMLHVLIHNENDGEAHDHSPEFLNEFHDRSNRLGTFVYSCLQNLPQMIEKHKRKLTQATLRSLDAGERANRSVATLTEPSAN